MTLYEKFNDEEKETFRKWLTSHLVHGPISVTFTKKDGTARTMNCTLKDTLVKSYEKKTERSKTVSEEACAVFDIDKQEWRSFRYDSITVVTLKV